jgi:hypothetical protein
LEGNPKPLDREQKAATKEADKARNQKSLAFLPVFLWLVLTPWCIKLLFARGRFQPVSDGSFELGAPDQDPESRDIMPSKLKYATVSKGRSNGVDVRCLLVDPTTEGMAQVVTGTNRLDLALVCEILREDHGKNSRSGGPMRPEVPVTRENRIEYQYAQACGGDPKRQCLTSLRQKPGQTPHFR